MNAYSASKAENEFLITFLSPQGESFELTLDKPFSPSDILNMTESKEKQESARRGWRRSPLALERMIQ